MGQKGRKSIDLGRAARCCERDTKATVDPIVERRETPLPRRWCTRQSPKRDVGIETFQSSINEKRVRRNFHRWVTEQVARKRDRWDLVIACLTATSPLGEDETAFDSARRFFEFRRISKKKIPAVSRYIFEHISGYRYRTYRVHAGSFRERLLISRAASRQ